MEEDLPAKNGCPAKLHKLKLPIVEEVDFHYANPGHRKPEETQSSKLKNNIPSNFFPENDQGFLKFCLCVDKLTLKLNLGNQKWPKLELLQEIA